MEVSVGEVARTLGQNASVEFKGQTYPLSPITFEVQAQFELWLERRALGRLAIHRRHLSEEEYDEYRQATVRDVNSGVYTWGTEACQRALASVPGIKQLAFLCLKKAMTAESPEVTPAVVDQMFDDAAFADQLSQAMRDLNASPNPPAPAQPGSR
jgi:hypothetical protein